MILLVTAADAASHIAARLQRAIGGTVFVAQNFSDAIAQLRKARFDLVVLDPSVIEAEPYELNTMYAAQADAASLEINLAITGMDRLVAQVQSALRRRERDAAALRTAVVNFLRGELNEALTTILLETGLLLEMPGLPPGATEKLASVHGAAQRIRSLLAGEGRG
jgi:hypothetical protein